MAYGARPAPSGSGRKSNASVDLRISILDVYVVNVSPCSALAQPGRASAIAWAPGRCKCDSWRCRAWTVFCRRDSECQRNPHRRCMFRWCRPHGGACPCVPPNNQIPERPMSVGPQPALCGCSSRPHDSLCSAIMAPRAMDEAPDYAHAMEGSRESRACRAMQRLPSSFQAEVCTFRSKILEANFAGTIRGAATNIKPRHDARCSQHSSIKRVLRLDGGPGAA